MTTLDHLFATVLIVVLPALSAWDMPRLAQRVAADPLDARTKVYLSNMAVQWGVTLALIGAWRWVGRPARDLGLQLPPMTSGWWWTLLITGLAMLFILQQGYSLLTSSEAQAQVRKQLETQPDLRAAMPSTAREARAFSGVAVTAGICEEVLYRGFLLWYFQSIVPGGAAVAVTVVVFGAAHLYQGLRGMISTGVAGGIFMAAYLLTGSLLAPIVLHTLLDLVNGLAFYRTLSHDVTTGHPS